MEGPKIAEIANIVTPPAAPEELLTRMRIERFRMPKTLRLIADAMLSSPAELSILSVNELSERLKVSPSALVRLAKSLGYSGYSPMQKVLLGGLARGGEGYLGRTEDLAGSARNERGEIDYLFEAITSANARAMDRAATGLDMVGLEEVVAILKSRRVIGVAGQRQSFPLAFYLYHGLLEAGRAGLLVDGVAGMGAPQAMALTDKDALALVAMEPLTGDLAAIARETVERGVTVIVIAGCDETGVEDIASEVLRVTDARLKDIRSIVITATVIQTIFESLRMEIEVSRRRSK